MSCPFFKGNLPAGAANPHEGGERRLATVAAHLAPALAPSPVAAPGSQPASYLAELKACKTELLALLDEINCNPILVRLAWHDAGTFDASLAAWPACGGANGSIRFQAELEHGANAGLAKGINVYLMPIHKRHPAVSWADLIQLGSACAVAHAGGPAIPMRYGRVDVPDAACCPPSGRLPDAAPPYGGGAPDAATHLRAVFHRMGFNDAEIVALSGAHTLGRAFKERSGQSEFGCVPRCRAAVRTLSRTQGGKAHAVHPGRRASPGRREAWRGPGRRPVLDPAVAQVRQLLLHGAL